MAALCGLAQQDLARNDHRFMVWPINSRGTPSSGEHVRSTHRVSQRKDGKTRKDGNHCSLAYSALASLRMGMSGSASFQRTKKS
jgi:hypothetical protein